MRRLLALAMSTLLAISLLSTVPAVADVPAGYEHSDMWFTAHDGIQLHASAYLPADRAEDEVHPIILVPTPYAAPNGGALGLTGAVGSGPADVRFPELFAHPSFVTDRWAYVEVDTRGFGGSGGCFQYYMPNEMRDMRTMIEHIHAQDWAGEIGLWGKSYDAAQHVLALAEGNSLRGEIEGLAATVIQAPGLSGYTALWMNGIHYATGRYATTGVYNADDLFPSQNATYATDQNYAAAAGAPITDAANYPTCRSDNLVMMNAIGDRDDEFWAGKEPYFGAIGSDVPTFWLHGFYDANTKPTHMNVYSTLQGENRAWFGHFDHIRGQEAGVGRRAFFMDEAMRFLDRHVRGVDDGETDGVVTVEQGDTGEWRHEAQWPPADGFDWEMSLNDGSYVDQPGNSASAADGILTTTVELPHDAHLAGEVTIDVDAFVTAPGAHLVAFVYDIDEDGFAQFVQRGAQVIADENTVNNLSFELYPVDWEFREGHRIGVLLTSGDDNWFSPGGMTGLDVGVFNATATFPLIAADRTDLIAGDPSKGSGVSGPSFDAEELDAAVVNGQQLPAEQTR